MKRSTTKTAVAKTTTARRPRSNVRQAMRPDDAVTAYINQCTETKRRALWRHRARLGASTIDTVDVALLESVARGVGREAAAALLDTTTERVAARLGVTPMARAARRERVVPTRPVSSTIAVDVVEPTKRERPASELPPLVDDARYAVELRTLAPGATFKMPDYPREGMRGAHGTLLYVNECRARVRLNVAPKTVRLRREDNAEREVEFTRSGEIDWAARTMVVPIVRGDT